MTHDSQTFAKNTEQAPKRARGTPVVGLLAIGIALGAHLGCVVSTEKPEENVELGEASSKIYAPPGIEEDLREQAEEWTKAAHESAQSGIQVCCKAKAKGTAWWNALDRRQFTSIACGGIEEFYATYLQSNKSAKLNASAHGYSIKLQIVANTCAKARHKSDGAL